MMRSVCEPSRPTAWTVKGSLDSRGRLANSQSPSSEPINARVSRMRPLSNGSGRRISRSRSSRAGASGHRHFAAASAISTTAAAGRTGIALYRMVANPWQHLIVEMIEPERHWAALTKPEKRVIERRIGWISGLGRLTEPEALMIPRVEWQSARIGGSIKTGGWRDIEPRNVAMRSDRGKWIIIGRLAGKSGKNAPFHLCRAQSVGKIRLKDCRRPNFQKDPIAFGDEPLGRLGEPHRVSYIAPPVISVERVFLNSLA